MDRKAAHEWHVAINKHCHPSGGLLNHQSWMYEAKTMHAEVPRLALLFSMERKGELPSTHRQCSHSPLEEVPDNHLFCCLGKVCRECPHLKALDLAEISEEEKDEAKAWTCAAHIVSEGGDLAGEGYILTVEDRMYWDRVYESMAQSDPADTNDNPARRTSK